MWVTKRQGTQHTIREDTEHSKVLSYMVMNDFQGIVPLTEPAAVYGSLFKSALLPLNDLCRLQR
jgi:hypothetical protein